jgi:hypothetical protein
VHASQRSLSAVKRQAGLHEFAIKPVRPEFLLTPRTRKEPTIIGLCFDMNFENARQFGFKKYHDRRTSASGAALPRSWPSFFQKTIAATAKESDREALGGNSLSLRSG